MLKQSSQLPRVFPSYDDLINLAFLALKLDEIYYGILTHYSRCSMSLFVDMD